MSLFEALILGLVQGATEFLPISSSAHLEFARRLLGVENSFCFEYFDLACHAGTVFAAALYFRKEIASIFTSLRAIASFSLALFPLIPVYFLLKPFRTWVSDPYYIGYGLLVTAALLFFSSREKKEPVNDEFTPLCLSRLKWQDVVCIGIMQTFALMPGISRSGSTMAAARFRGWSWIDAARFSFLLAIPSVFGGECLETVKLIKGSSETAAFLPWSYYAAGFFSAFGLGFYMIRWIFSLYRAFNAAPFAYYCAALGLLALVFFHA